MTNSQEPINARSRRLTFSLRFLLAVTVCFAVYFAFTLHRLRRNKAAVEALKAQNATFSISYDGPRWLRHLIDDDEYFYNLSRVSLGVSSGDYDHEDPLTDKALVDLLPHLRTFSKFRTLTLCGTEITDESISHLATLRTLERLDLSATKVTDTGAKELVELRQLKDLELGGTALTPAGAKLLNNGLPNCRIRGLP